MKIKKSDLKMIIREQIKLSSGNHRHIGRVYIGGLPDIVPDEPVEGIIFSVDNYDGEMVLRIDFPRDGSNQSVAITQSELSKLENLLGMLRGEQNSDY